MSGTGEIGYLVDGGVIGKKLGLGPPLVLVWPSRDVSEGIGQSDAASAMPAQDFDLSFHSLEKQNAEYEEKIRPLLSKSTEKVRTGSTLTIFCRGSSSSRKGSAGSGCR